jgi:hypothetical protein
VEQVELLRLVLRHPLGLHGLGETDRVHRIAESRHLRDSVPPLRPP